MDKNSSELAQRNDPESLAPVQVDKVSVEDEAAQMNRGRYRQLAALAVVTAGCVIGGVLWMRGMDARQRQEQAIASVAQLHEDHVDAFLGCAIAGVHRSQLASVESLHSAIARYGERLGRSYGRTLERCEPKLAGLLPALRAFEANEHARAELAALRTAALELQQAWVDYRKLLTQGDEYDAARAFPRIERIASAFGKYEKRRADLERTLRARL